MEAGETATDRCLHQRSTATVTIEERSLNLATAIFTPTPLGML